MGKQTGAGSPKTAIVKADSSTADILASIEKMKEHLKHIEETPYKAGTNLQPFGNIREETNIAKLVHAAGMVVAKQESYNKGADALKLRSVPVFNVDGHGSDAWIHDINLRIDIVTNKEQYDKMKDFEKRARDLMTEADKKELLVKDIAAFLQGGPAELTEDAQE